LIHDLYVLTHNT